MGQTFGLPPKPKGTGLVVVGVMPAKAKGPLGFVAYTKGGK